MTFSLTSSVNVWSGTDKLIKDIGRGKMRIMMRAGALARGVMKRMIRYRKRKQSQPGEPPFAHTSSGEFGLRMIQYKYDPTTETVIAGPVDGGSSGKVPKILDEGGTVMIRSKGGTHKAVRIKARPFRKPTLDIVIGRYPKLWEDSLI